MGKNLIRIPRQIGLRKYQNNPEKHQHQQPRQHGLLSLDLLKSLLSQTQTDFDRFMEINWKQRWKVNNINTPLFNIRDSL